MAREWHPALCVDDVITRLIDWFRDAAADRFDGRGSLLPPNRWCAPEPSVLAEHSSFDSQIRSLRGPLVGRATIDVRWPQRHDLIRWGSKDGADPPTATSALVLRTTKPMPYGLQAPTLGELAARVEVAGGPSKARSLAAAAWLLPHLVDGLFRVIVEERTPTTERSHTSPMPSESCRGTPLHFRPLRTTCLPYRSDGLLCVTMPAEVATWRDQQRPASAFNGRSIELWGCGGLGSWMAEFIVRAGAKQIVLRDTGGVSTGLLVRQNYVEHDVGLAKPTSWLCVFGRSPTTSSSFRSLFERARPTGQGLRPIDRLADRCHDQRHRRRPP